MFPVPRFAEIKGSPLTPVRRNCSISGLDHLKAEVVPLLRHAGYGASIQSLTLDIAVGLANRLETRNLNAKACENLALTITEIAKTSRT